MSKKKRDREFWESSSLNRGTYMQYYNRLTELSMVMFEWVNLPDTIDPRFLEMVLYRDGKAVFFKDEDLGYLVLRANCAGDRTVYEIPKERHVYASNGYHNTLDDTDSVIIWNNYLHTNSMLDVEMFARRLYQCDRTIDVNLNAQKTPILIQCSEQQKFTMMNAYKQYQGNEPFIFGDKSIDMTGVKVFTTGAPFIADKVRQEKSATWNEALTYFGISNVSYQKKERMVSDEMIRSMGGTIASRYSRLEMRRQACAEINKMFPDLNIDCRYREDFREADDEVMISGETGDGKMTDMVVDLRTN